MDIYHERIEQGDTMNKKLMAVLLSALLLVSSFGFTSCQDEPVEPNFENFPLDVQADLRWGTEYNTGD